MLRQDPLPRRCPARRAGEPQLRSILVAALAADAVAGLVDLALPLARRPERELVVVTTVASVDELGPVGEALSVAARPREAPDGVEIRTAVFLSLTPGVDLGRLAAEQDVDLLLADAPDGLLEDARVLALLEQAPCDVGVVVGTARPRRPGPRPLRGRRARLGGGRARSVARPQRRQRSSGSRAPPPAPSGSRRGPAARERVDRACSARSASPPSRCSSSRRRRRSSRRPPVRGIVVVGLTDRWRHEGLGRARTALATRADGATILVRARRPAGRARSARQPDPLHLDDRRLSAA